MSSDESLPLEYAQHSCLNHLGIYYVAKDMKIVDNQLKQAVSVATDIGAVCRTRIVHSESANQENVAAACSVIQYHF